MSKQTSFHWTCTYQVQSDGSVEAFRLEDSEGNSLLGACSCCNGTYIAQDGESNARIITAAPELVEAIEYLILATKPMSEQQKECWKSLEAAIAKARGISQ